MGNVPKDHVIPFSTGKMGQPFEMFKFIPGIFQADKPKIKVFSIHLLTEISGICDKVNGKHAVTPMGSCINT